MSFSQHVLGHMWGGGDKTGKYRYSQRSLDVNEAVSVLGVSTPGQTPAGERCKIMAPLTAGMLDEAFFKTHHWESWDVDSWKELSQHSALILSDAKIFTSKVQVRTQRAARPWSAGARLLMYVIL